MRTGLRVATRSNAATESRFCVGGGRQVRSAPKSKPPSDELDLRWRCDNQFGRCDRCLRFGEGGAGRSSGGPVVTCVAERDRRATLSSSGRSPGRAALTHLNPDGVNAHISLVFQLRI
jgi:hypothetical protein